MVPLPRPLAAVVSSWDCAGLGSRCPLRGPSSIGLEQGHGLEAARAVWVLPVCVSRGARISHVMDVLNPCPTCKWRIDTVLMIGFSRS